MVNTLGNDIMIFTLHSGNCFDSVIATEYGNFYSKLLIEKESESSCLRTCFRKT